MPSDDALASSDVQVHQHGHEDGAILVSDDALLSSHDDTLASSDAEVGQGSNDDGALASSDDAPNDDALVSSDLHVHQ